MPLSDYPVATARTDFAGERALRTHSRAYKRWLFSNDDGTANTTMPMFTLEGSARNTLTGEVISLTAWLRWDAGSFLVLDIPEGSLVTTPIGFYGYEIVVRSSSTDVRPVIGGSLQIISSVHRP